MWISTQKGHIWYFHKKKFQKADKRREHCKPQGLALEGTLAPCSLASTLSTVSALAPTPWQGPDLIHIHFLGGDYQAEKRPWSWASVLVPCLICSFTKQGKGDQTTTWILPQQQHRWVLKQKTRGRQVCSVLLAFQLYDLPTFKKCL